MRKKFCDSVGCFEMGYLSHVCALECRFEADVFVGSSLIDMYAKAGKIQCARQISDKLPERDVIVWTSMIAPYKNNGQEKLALELFCQVELEGAEQDEVIFMNGLNACAGISALEKVKLIHVFIIEHGFKGNILVGNALVDMYLKSGSTNDACKVLYSMPKRDAVSWNSIIIGCAHYGHGKEAFSFLIKCSRTALTLIILAFLAFYLLATILV